MKIKLLLLLVISFHILIAEEITLKNNQIIKAPLIKENLEKIFVDLGFSILEIPRSEIVSLEKEKTETDQEEGAQTADVQKEGLVKNKLFTLSEGVNADTTLESCVKQVQEAVVFVASPVGTGSGFIINEDGYLITNAHVIQNQSKISVTMFLQKNDRIDTIVINKVKIIAVNNYRDLALLQIEREDSIKDLEIPFVPIANFKNIQNGQEVFAVGNPFGLRRTVSQGIISSTNRHLQGHTQLFIQTTTAINPGNSGGPLFNKKGEVVGVNSLGFVKSMAEGLNFAIPSKYLIDFLENYEAFAYDKNNPNNGYSYFEFPELKVKISKDEL